MILVILFLVNIIASSIGAIVGAVQAACLAIVTFAVLLYICNKEKIVLLAQSPHASGLQSSKFHST